MKVVHINFWDKQGGAAIAAYRLHKAMINTGIDSNILVFNKLIKDNTSIHAIDSFFNKIIIAFFNICESRLLAKFRPYIGNFSISLMGLNISKLKIVQDADVIYLHWINNNFVSISSIAKLLKLGKPIVWFLHDMWPMTGGCHHSFECIKYQSQCEYCDLLKSNKKKDISSKIFNKKLRLFSSYQNLKIITPSEWLGDCAKKSALFTHIKVRVIPNMIDITIFKPIDKQYARNILNLPENKKIILFGADMGVSNPYKGWGYLKDALKNINPSYIIVTFGGESIDLSLNDTTFPAYNFGRLFDDYSLALLYNACDVFVIPSLAEAFGQTALEAITCGTPAVGFNVGGIPDIISHKVTGYLSNYKDAYDLSVGINWVLDNPRYKDLSAQCRSYAIHKFSSKRVVKQHLTILSEDIQS